MTDEEGKGSKISPVSLSEISTENKNPHAARWADKQLELIRDVKVGISVRLGGCDLTVSRLFDLKEGDTLTLDQHVDDLVEGTGGRASGRKR